MLAFVVAAIAPDDRVPADLVALVGAVVSVWMLRRLGW